MEDEKVGQNAEITGQYGGVPRKEQDMRRQAGDLSRESYRGQKNIGKRDFPEALINKSKKCSRIVLENRNEKSLTLFNARWI